jgi:hypothetical protein
MKHVAACASYRMLTHQPFTLGESLLRDLKAEIVKQELQPVRPKVQIKILRVIMCGTAEFIVDYSMKRGNQPLATPRTRRNVQQS